MTTSITRNAYYLDDIETQPSISIRRIDNEHSSSESNEVLQNEVKHIYYPEGGFVAWTVVFGAFCGLCGGVGTMNTMGAFQKQISQDQLHDYSDGEFG
jgi:hypothetical protein